MKTAYLESAGKVGLSLGDFYYVRNAAVPKIACGYSARRYDRSTAGFRQDEADNLLDKRDSDSVSGCDCGCGDQDV